MAAKWRDIARQIDLTRNIILTGPVNLEMVAAVEFQLGALSTTKEPITVSITSKGGHYESGLAIYDTLRTSPIPIVTVAKGTAESAASLIFCAGRVRLIMPNAKLMIHAARIKFGEEEELSGAECLDLGRHLMTQTAKMQALYVERTGISPETMGLWLLNTKYFDAKEAVEHGFAHGIYKREYADFKPDASDDSDNSPSNPPSSAEVSTNESSSNDPK